MLISNQLRPFLREGGESETLLINQMSLAKQARGETVFKFGFGQSPFPVPKHIVSAMAQAAFRKEYSSVQGHPELREAIAGFHNQHDKVAWNAEDVVVGSGSKILLFCIMASLQKANILLPRSSWVSYAPQAELAGHDAYWINTEYDGKWKIDPDVIEATCSSIRETSYPKILILNYPSNPTGQTYSAEELQILAEYLRRKEILVVADEIYNFLDFSGASVNLSHYYPEGVLTTSGLSKWCGAGGWRLGYVHLPPSLNELKERLISVASETYSCAASPIQVAATLAYTESDKAKAYLTSQRRALSYVSNDISKRLNQAGIRVHPAQGGFYLFPDFSHFKQELAVNGISTSHALTAAIMQQTGVALLPGAAFGMPPDSLTVRLAFVDFDGEQALQAPEDSQIYQHSYSGVERLCEWCTALC